MDLADMNKTVAMGSGHLGIDFRKDYFSVLGGSKAAIDGHAEAAPPIFIGGRDGEHGHIDWEPPFAK
jgi:hypothetical protein